MEDEYILITKAKAQGHENTLKLLLDVLEPVSVLSAQVLWMIQPISGLFGGNQMIKELATVLEEPDGIEKLRKQLEDDQDDYLNHHRDE